MPLYLVSTPIGNLEDMTLRAIRTLKEVDLIACEDTRHTRRLLNHFGIDKPTISYYEQNEHTRAAELVERMERGESIALVSDAGTPGISDPAYRVVKLAIERGITVTPVPGPTALIAALSGSGLPSDSFLFAGFLPPKQKARRSRLEELKFERATLIFYEAPHRIKDALADAIEVLGDREASAGRELTKLHEEFIRGRLSDIAAFFETRHPRGELALVIAGNREDNLKRIIDIPIGEQIEKLMLEEGMSRNQALKASARSRGLAKRDAYRLLLEEKDALDED